jgi:hypothetical protein
MSIPLLPSMLLSAAFLNLPPKNPILRIKLRFGV